MWTDDQIASLLTMIGEIRMAAYVLSAVACGAIGWACWSEFQMGSRFTLGERQRWEDESWRK